MKQVVTIEHDPLWYQEVANTLEKKESKNVLLKLVEPVRFDRIDLRYASTDTRYKYHGFEQYIKMIDAYPDEFTDIVVFDGRAQAGCMKQVMAKIKVGTCSSWIIQKE